MTGRACREGVSEPWARRHLYGEPAGTRGTRPDRTGPRERAPAPPREMNRAP